MENYDNLVTLFDKGDIKIDWDKCLYMRTNIPVKPPVLAVDLDEGYGGHTHLHVNGYGETPLNWNDRSVRDLYPKSIFATEHEKPYNTEWVIANPNLPPHWATKFATDEFKRYICERENNTMSNVIKDLKSNTTIPESLKPGMMMSILQGNGIDEDYAVELFKKYLYQKGYDYLHQKGCVSDRHNQTQPRPKKIHVSNGVTTVIWDDNTKSQVRMQENEPTQDIEKGVAMAIAKKALGNNANWYDLFAVLRNLSEEGEYDVSCTIPNEKELRKDRKDLEKLERLMSDENARVVKDSDVKEGLKWDHADIPVFAKVEEANVTGEGCLVKACPLYRYLIQWNIEDASGKFQGGNFKIRGTDHTDAFDRAVDHVKKILATDNIDDLRMTVTQIND